MSANIDQKPVMTRFAPSPTGYLHLGHAYSAILNYEAARDAGGRFILRIEDIDDTRCKPACEEAIYEDLAWLGLSWEVPVWRQSERMDIYAAALENLRDRGLIYRCFKTRKDIEEAMSAPHGAGAAYTGAALPKGEEEALLATGAPFAWRLSMKAARDALGPDLFDRLTYREDTGQGTVMDVPANAASYGDIVLGRKDCGTSYHLACTLDDAAQGVTHVIRGEDLREAAGIQTLLHEIFGHRNPVYRHHALVTGDDGRRLAKRDSSVTLRHLRDAGLTPEDIRARLSGL